MSSSETARLTNYPQMCAVSRFSAGSSVPDTRLRVSSYESPSFLSTMHESSSLRVCRIDAERARVLKCPATWLHRLNNPRGDAGHFHWLGWKVGVVSITDVSFAPWVLQKLTLRYDLIRNRLVTAVLSNPWSQSVLCGFPLALTIDILQNRPNYGGEDWGDWEKHAATIDILQQGREQRSDFVRQLAIEAIILYNSFMLQDQIINTHHILSFDLLLIPKRHSNMVNDYRDAIRTSAICLSLCSLSAVSTRIHRSCFTLGRLAGHDIFIIVALVSILPRRSIQQFQSSSQHRRSAVSPRLLACFFSRLWGWECTMSMDR